MSNPVQSLPFTPSPAPTFEMPRFNGTGSVNEFIRLFRKNAVRNGWTPLLWTRFLPAYLEGAARFLWDDLPDGDEPSNWDDAVNVLKHLFSGNDDVAAVEAELFRRRQAPSERYVEYEQNILSLAGRLERTVLEDEKIRMIVRGLNDDLFFHVFLADPMTLAELTKVATRCERAVAAVHQRYGNGMRPEDCSPAYRRPADFFEPSERPSPRRTDVMRTTDGRPICFVCTEPGHVAKFCRQTNFSTRVRDVPQVNQQQTSLMEIFCKVNGHDAGAIVDTGACMTVLDEHFARRIKLDCFSTSQFFVRTPGGHEVRAPLTCRAMIEANGERDFIDVVVLKDLPTDVLLGLDWITKHSPVLDFRTPEILTRTTPSFAFAAIPKRGTTRVSSFDHHRLATESEADSSEGEGNVANSPSPAEKEAQTTPIETRSTFHTTPQSPPPLPDPAAGGQCYNSGKTTGLATFPVTRSRSQGVGAGGQCHNSGGTQPLRALSRRRGSFISPHGTDWPGPDPRDQYKRGPRTRRGELLESSGGDPLPPAAENLQPTADIYRTPNSPFLPADSLFPSAVPSPPHFPAEQPIESPVDQPQTIAEVTSHPTLRPAAPGDQPPPQQLFSPKTASALPAERHVTGPPTSPAVQDSRRAHAVLPQLPAPDHRNYPPPRRRGVAGQDPGDAVRATASLLPLSPFQL